MELLTQLNRAMLYVEENICGDMTLAGIASATSYSEYHFCKLFYYIADMPLSEYVRKRRLSLAAMDLQSGCGRVMDVAVKYGYDSADSFTRAFVKQHGVTPTAARNHGTALMIFPPITFQIHIEGVQGMNWRIEQREAFEVFGIERSFKNDESGTIPSFWDEIQKDGSMARLLEKAAGLGPMAICGHVDEKATEFPYMICCELKDGCDASGYKITSVPSATWAVFREDGMKDHEDVKIPELFRKAYSEWLPSSGYEKYPGPDMEIYGNAVSNEIYEEVWIPIIKK